MTAELIIDHQRLTALCQRYHVQLLELFGSHARGDATPESDVDVLVTFLPGHHPGLDFFAFCLDLETLFNRPVDVLTHASVETDRNPVFKDQVLTFTAPLYAA